MPRKKGYGLSRKKLQQLTKLTRLRRKAGITCDPQSIFGFVQTAGRKDVEVVRIEGVSIAPKVGVVRRVKLTRPVVLPTYKSASSIASVMVKASSQQVMEALGIRILEPLGKPEVLITPEIAHSVGKLVATRAVCLASEYVAAGSHGGGGRVSRGGIIGAIGRSGVDVAISPEGEVSATVTSKPTKKRKAPKTKKTADTSTKVPEETKKGTKSVSEDGATTVIKGADGTTIIHIHFDIHVENVVHQLNVNPQEVKNYMATQITSLKEIIEQKVIEAKAVVDDKNKLNENKEEDEKKNSKKKKKKDEDEDTFAPASL